MNDTVLGQRTPLSELANAAPPAEPHVPLSIKAHTVALNAVGKRMRDGEIRRIVGSDEPTRLPNPVRFNADPESMLDERFLIDALQETRERPGALVSGDDPNTFEFLAVETLRTEAGALFEPLKREIDATDPSRQVLVLSGRPILLTEEVDGRKARKPYHLIRLNRNRAHVERKGIALPSQ